MKHVLLLHVNHYYFQTDNQRSKRHYLKRSPGGLKEILCLWKCIFGRQHVRMIHELTAFLRQCLQISNFAINIALYFILIYEEQSLIPSSSNTELIMLTFDFVSSVDFKSIRKIRLNLDLINWAKINPKPPVTINCGHSGPTYCCPSCSTLEFTIWNSVWALLRHAPFIMLCNKLFFIKSLVRIANESIIDTVLRYINSDTVELVICTIKLGAPFWTLTIPILRNQMFSTRIVKCVEFIRVPLTSSSKRCILRRGVFAVIIGCPLIPVKVIFSNTSDGSTIV